MTPLSLMDFAPKTDDLTVDALEGLGADPKSLPCKYFYDEVGSALFDDICRLPEYYPTRTEMSIMRDNIEEMARLLGENVLLIEYGAGSCTKTHLLLDALHLPAAYIPIDISREHLLRSANDVLLAFPMVEILPVCADYCSEIRLPTSTKAERRRVVYFPGSTIGNFHRDEALGFLKRIRQLVGSEGALLLGVDLKKDRQTLYNAYNDSQGVTAAFNLNLLRRLNKECCADFSVSDFRHEAIWNEEHGRIEMRLFSEKQQQVYLAGNTFDFAEGESILTECSYKYSPRELSELARRSGFEVGRLWTDKDNLFSVQYLIAE